MAVRVNYLVDSITYALFQYVARGLFEQDRLVYTVQQTFQILIASGDVDPVDVDFFLRFPVVSGLNVSGSPVDYLTPATWSVVKSISQFVRILKPSVEKTLDEIDRFVVDGRVPALGSRH